MDFRESDPSSEARGTVQFSMGYIAGLQLQLNFLEPHVAERARITTGLENTYLDIFATYYDARGKLADLGSDLSWGTGLRLEF